MLVLPLVLPALFSAQECAGPRACTREMNPVCGSNNVTYNNLCLFGFAQCDNATLTMTAVGTCDAPRLECPSVCEEIFSPVCGSDGITYANKCEYRRGKCANLALEMVNPLGPCDESKHVERDCSAVACISVWDPVCGSDGKTYSNACELDMAKCKQGSTTLQIAHNGDCARGKAMGTLQTNMKVAIWIALCVSGLVAEKDFCASNMGCNRMYSPVCGSDGVKYSNKCLFDKAKCTNPELAVATDKTSCQAKHSERELSEHQGCIHACHEIYQPVCGSDGQTYSNECSLKRESCLKRVKVEIKSPGRCPEEKKQDDERVLLEADSIDDCPRACIEIFQPVCGTDGNTYANKCTLKQDACARKVAINVAHEGDCDGKLRVSNLQADAPAQTQCPRGCPEIYHAVCGTDGNTYENECTLHRLACENKVDVAVAHDGKCDDKNTNLAAQPPATTQCRKGCPEIYHAVCGTDGKTYENECTLQRIACENKIDVAVAHDGDCEGRFPIKREVKECPVACIEILRPVCGSDGKTYDNECFLKRAACSNNVHIQVAHEGMCIVDEMK